MVIRKNQLVVLKATKLPLTLSVLEEGDSQKHQEFSMSSFELASNHLWLPGPSLRIN